MSTSFRPQEAREDNYVLGLISLVLLALAVSFIAYSSYHSGLKYIVLKLTGIETQSYIFAINDIGTLSTEELTSMGISYPAEYTGLIDEVVVEFREEDGSYITGSFIVPRQRNRLREDTELPVIYSSLNPNIFLPVDDMPKYRFDARLLMISIAGLIVLLLAGAYMISRWRSFRKRARRY